MSSSKKPRPSGASTGSNSRTEQAGSIAYYAILSFIAFLCGIGVLSVMLWNAQTLAALGLTGNLYYVVLLPLGMSVAAFLFGVLHSIATYSGKQFGGKLTLGGPIVASALVVIGGFFFTKSPGPDTFPLTVYVQGEGGPHDLVLRNAGYVYLDLGPDRRKEPIGDNGQAYFPAIPAKYRGQKAPIWVDADGFETVGASGTYSLDDSAVYLPVRKKDVEITGHVQDENGNPITGAVLSMAGVSGSSNAVGEFKFEIPGGSVRAEFELRATAMGYDAVNYTIIPNANEAIITMKRSDKQ